MGLKDVLALIQLCGIVAVGAGAIWAIRATTAVLKNTIDHLVKAVDKLEKTIDRIEETMSKHGERLAVLEAVHD